MFNLFYNHLSLQKKQKKHKQNQKQNKNSIILLVQSMYIWHTGNPATENKQSIQFLFPLCELFISIRKQDFSYGFIRKTKSDSFIWTDNEVELVLNWSELPHYSHYLFGHWYKNVSTRLHFAQTHNDAKLEFSGSHTPKAVLEKIS